MRRIIQLTVVCVLALMVTLPVLAQEKAKKKAGGGAPPQVAALKKQLAELDLSEDQKSKIATVMASHTEKLTAAQKKVSELLTADQRKARTEAAAKAKSDGKKGKEIQEAANAALKLPPDVQEKFSAAEKELAAAVADMRKAVGEVLTDEQKAKVGLKAPAKKGKAK